MEFIVDGNTWLRGQGGAGSRLLAEDGRRCCVGFYAQAQGFKDKHMLNVGAFLYMNTELDLTRWECGINGNGADTTDIGRIYSVNDSTFICDQERMARLTKLFAKHDVQVKFINVPGCEDKEVARP